MRPVLEYAQLAWCGLSAQDINHLERLQRRAARVITGVKPWSSTGTCHDVLVAHAGLPTLSERRLIAQAVFVFKVVNDFDIPCHLSNLIQAWLPEKPCSQRHVLHVPACLNFNNITSRSNQYMMKDEE